MLASTFRLLPGIGPGREQRLWQQGIGHWTDLLGGVASGLSPAIDSALRAAVIDAQDARARGDTDGLARMLPPGERWRMFADFGDGAAYLDIETSDDDVAFAGISAIGICDRDGPRIFLAGRDLHLFPQAARGYSMLVTFNGSSFDLPILGQAFPEWAPPACHLDLRHLLARVGHHGGLKAIERAQALQGLRLTRPPHLARVAGWDAAWLWRRGRGPGGDRDALRAFVEYNLHDVIHLRTLIAYAYNALVDQVDAPAVRAHVGHVPVPTRGDVLYDVSKILLGL
ncbi:MAG TPA: ribonuclease H-like domain-containing protein [Polyangia bacterium]|nr:ribonuclease H-like domain-containing protein [Polyangia bacterium]